MSTPFINPGFEQFFCPEIINEDLSEQHFVHFHSIFCATSGKDLGKTWERFSASV